MHFQRALIVSLKAQSAQMSTLRNILFVPSLNIIEHLCKISIKEKNDQSVSRVLQKVVIWPINALIEQVTGISATPVITVDFGELKTAPTECKETFFQIMSPAYHHCSKAPRNVLMLMIHLRKRSAR